MGLVGRHRLTPQAKNDDAARAGLLETYAPPRHGTRAQVRFEMSEHRNLFTKADQAQETLHVHSLSAANG